MIRILLLYLLPVLTVAALYLVWVYRNKIQSPPKAVIIVFCIVAVIIGIVGYFLHDDNFSPETSYTAPHIENGQIVPAKMTQEKE